MSEFKLGEQRLILALAVFGGAAATFTAAFTVASLEASLVAMTVYVTAIILFLVDWLGTANGERFDAVERKLDQGFDEALENLDGADASTYHTRTDGSGWKTLPGLTVEKVEFSGIPSAAGAAAGGAVGALFGPAGAGLGALLGAAVGGGTEYHNLKGIHRDRLERAAWTAVTRMAQVREHQLTLEDVDDAPGITDDYWQFKFSQDDGDRHQVRISKTDGSVQYRPRGAENGL